MEKDNFGKRLSHLRMEKGVSARDMSLSLGQAPGYINNIENGCNYPSMSAFFYICDYLGVKPTEFFDEESNNPVKINLLLSEVKILSETQLDILIALAKDLGK